MRRTVEASLAPLPRQPMTMPSKIWIRSRVPSTTLACTFTVSPGIKVGTFFRWDSASSRLMTLDTAYKDITLDPPLPLVVEQVGAAMARPFRRLGAAPALDLGVVARAQHVGDGMSLELRRPGVVGVLEKLLVEGFVLWRFFGPQHPGDQPADGVDHDHGGEFATCLHVVADRDLLVDQVRRDPLINALIASADQVEVIVAGELAYQPLVKQFALRREQDHRPFAGARPHRFEDRLGLQHHPGAAAIRDIIDLPVAVVGVIAQVMDAQRDDPGGEPPSSHPGSQGAREHRGKEGKDLDDHALGFLREVDGDRPLGWRDRANDTANHRDQDLVVPVRHPQHVVRCVGQDLRDLAQLAARRGIDDPQADQLEVVVLVGGQCTRLAKRHGEIAGELLGRRSIVDARKRDQHGAAQIFGPGYFQPSPRQQHLAAGSEAIGKVGEELDAHSSPYAVRLEHAPDPKIGLRFDRHTISTITRSWFLRAAARTTARIASMLRPPRPITLPTSSVESVTSTRLVRSPSTIATLTSSGFETIALMM